MPKVTSQAIREGDDSQGTSFKCVSKVAFRQNASLHWSLRDVQNREILYSSGLPVFSGTARKAGLLFIAQVAAPSTASRSPKAWALWAILPMGGLAANWRITASCEPESRAN
jgi:hypothetical protein